MSDIVDRINEDNRKKHGDIQACCGLFRDYCRCETKIPYYKDYFFFTPANAETPNIEVIPCDSDHSLDEVSKWFRKKLMEASKISEKPIPNIKPTTLGLELPTLDMKTGKLKWSIWQRGFWQQLKFWK